MNFKLDENLGSRGKDFLIKAGHQVETVHDFANPLRFNPADYRGIAVLRLPAKFTFSDLMIAISTLAKAVETESIDR